MNPCPILFQVGDVLCLGSGLNCELELKLWDGGLNNSIHHIGGGEELPKLVCSLDSPAESISVPNVRNNVIKQGGPLFRGAPTPNLMGTRASNSEHNDEAPTLVQLSTQIRSSVKNLSDGNSICKKPQNIKTLRLMHPSISNYLGLGDVQDDFSTHVGAFWHQVCQ